MSPNPPPADPTRDHPIGRRAFLAGGVAAAAALARGRSPAAEPQPTTRPASRVLETVSPELFSGQLLRRNKYVELLEIGLCALADTDQPALAWRRWLKDDDTIGLKFNSSGAEVIGMTQYFAPILVESLLNADFKPEKIVLLEAGPLTGPLTRTQPVDLRYSDREFDFGCGSDSFIAFVDQVTAIVNVPFLKTHHSAVMTGCLKNLSHGLVRRPARFHANGCDPAIAAIVASEPIRSRLRLNIVNAVRAVVDRGPEAREADVAAFNGLILSEDPVAADAAGYEVLNALRANRKLRPLLTLPHVPRQLESAARRGLGVYDSEAWKLKRIEV